MGTIFSLRVIRCPACGATLKLHGPAAIVACEYCHARVEVARRSDPVPPPIDPGPRHVAVPHWSGVAWILLLVPIVVVGAGGLMAYRTASRASTPAPPSAPKTPTVLTPTSAPIVEPPRPSEAPEPLPSSDPLSSDLDPPPPQVETQRPSTASSRSTPSPASSLPVISVAQARAQLEPKVRACMVKAKVHHVVAYMGNKSSGAVKLLPDSRTRVDGKTVSLAKTPLGKCIDDAGKTVHTAAFKSNYVALDVRNDAVPDPLGNLPKKPDIPAVKKTIATFDDAVKACATKHGVEGSREVFYFKIDGPSGTLASVRASYLSTQFQKCAAAVYKKATFPKVQQASYDVTYSLDV